MGQAALRRYARGRRRGWRAARRWAVCRWAQCKLHARKSMPASFSSLLHSSLVRYSFQSATTLHSRVEARQSPLPTFPPQPPHHPSTHSTYMQAPTAPTRRVASPTSNGAPPALYPPAQCEVHSRRSTRASSSSPLHSSLARRAHRRGVRPTSEGVPQVWRHPEQCGARRSWQTLRALAASRRYPRMARAPSHIGGRGWSCTTQAQATCWACVGRVRR